MRQISSSTGDVNSPRAPMSAPLTPVCYPFGEDFVPRLLSEPFVNNMGSETSTKKHKATKQNSNSSDTKDSLQSNGFSGDVSKEDLPDKSGFNSRNYSFKENLRNVLKSSKNSLPAPVHGPRFVSISPRALMKREAKSQSIDQSLEMNVNDGFKGTNV